MDVKTNKLFNKNKTLRNPVRFCFLMGLSLKT